LKRPKTSSKTREYAEIVVAALLLAVFLRAFVVQAFKIPSGSMRPTLEIGDQILACKFSYGFKLPFVMKTLVPVGKPQRGDIVVFAAPRDPAKDYVKRVIGLPGDIVEIRNKRLYMNGALSPDPNGFHVDPLIIPGAIQPRDNFGPVTVAPGTVFVMGDNRDYSIDSRFWGSIEINELEGKVVGIFFSWDSDRNAVRWSRIGNLFR
jgi:signal peptidase I